MDYRSALTALAKAYDGVSQLVGGLTRNDLLAFSRCHGWVVVDVLFHLLCDAQRTLVALASPVPGSPDRDFVSFWTEFTPGTDESGAHAWWVRRSAAAFRDGTGVVALWQETAPAAVRAAERADHDGFFATLGHVLGTPDLLATSATEAVIHHLDMTVHLPAAADPDPDAVALATHTLDGLLGKEVARPAGWTPEEYLLKGTGRRPLSDSDRDLLGDTASRFPLLA
jgi:hypothetical protein